LPVVVALAATDKLGLPPLFQSLILAVVVGTLLIQGMTLEPVLAYILQKSDQFSMPGGEDEARSK
jgi:hypothetical protein